MHAIYNFGFTVCRYTLSYADLDWYKGVTKLNDTYVSAVFLSAAIHAPAIAITVPVYGNNTWNDNSNNNSNSYNNNDNNFGYSLSPILGYWVGIVDLCKIEEDVVAALGLRNGDSRILIVDHNGTQVLDTIDRNVSSSSSELKSYSYLESVKNTLNGEHGSVTGMINDTTVAIYIILYK